MEDHGLVIVELRPSFDFATQQAQLIYYSQHFTSASEPGLASVNVNVQSFDAL